jgi:hypothetical protein
MLKTLDVLIGVALVMLLGSLSVTALTQGALGILNSRGRHLLQGVVSLLRQIQPGMDVEVAQKISQKVLTHPLIHDGWGYGSVIQRDELTKILLELATEDGPQKMEADVKTQLVQALKDNGISQPKQIIDNVRDVLLHLELIRPDLASHVRHDIAFLEEARSTYLAKMNAWFDQTMDRVSQRFTIECRWITLAIGFVIALVVQLDTPLLVNRLSTDSQLRVALVQQAQSAAAADRPLSDQEKTAFQSAVNTDIFTVPASLAQWESNWTKAPDGSDRHPTVLGVLLTAVLLSFGAPFWFSTLKNLLRLRSVMADKEDNQRTQRQTAQPPPVPDGKAVPDSGVAAISIGEQGDLAAVG